MAKYLGNKVPDCERHLVYPMTVAYPLAHLFLCFAA